MATTVTKWHDGSNFVFAYAVYDDQKSNSHQQLMGFYQFGGYVRQQLNGKLEPYTYNVKMAIKETLSYSDGVKGWPSFYSFLPDYLIGMNSFFYSFHQGQLI